MGNIVKQVSEHTTRYYWYPGDKKEWRRAAIAFGAGLLAFVLMLWAGGSALYSVTLGASVTCAMGGVNFGRRDFRAAHGFPGLSGKRARRAAVLHGSRAAWRAMVEGVGGASAAVLIANLPARGILADWLLPIVPATAAALAHQAGMLYERLAQEAAPADLPPVPSGARAGARPEGGWVAADRKPVDRGHAAKARTPGQAAGPRQTPLGWPDESGGLLGNL